MWGRCDRRLHAGYASSLFPTDVCRFRNRCRRPTQLLLQCPVRVAPWCAFLCVPIATLPRQYLSTPAPPYSNPFAVEDNRRGRGCCDGGRGGGDDTSCSGNVGVYPFTRTRCVGVVGMFVEIPFVSMYAFWVAVLAYVVLALGNFLTPLKSA